MLKQFYLQRNEDASGVSGKGVVAIGVVFEQTGQAVMGWITEYDSLGIYPSIEELEKVHGHEGRTVVKWGTPPKEALKATPNLKESLKAIFK